MNEGFSFLCPGSKVYSMLLTKYFSSLSSQNFPLHSWTSANSVLNDDPIDETTDNNNNSNTANSNNSNGNNNSSNNNSVNNNSSSSNNTNNNSNCDDPIPASANKLKSKWKWEKCSLICLSHGPILYPLQAMISSSHQLVALAKVVHGHTWVEQCMDSTTLLVAANVTAEICTICPGIGTVLQCMCWHRMVHHNTNESLKLHHQQANNKLHHQQVNNTSLQHSKVNKSEGSVCWHRLWCCLPLCNRWSRELLLLHVKLETTLPHSTTQTLKLAWCSKKCL